MAEYQARGLVHFHAIFRLDGPELDDPPPSGATGILLCVAIEHAAATAQVVSPPCEALGEREPVRWGDQLDVRPVLNENRSGRVLSDGQVAGYVAKYATEGAEASGTIDRPLACRHCQATGRLPDNEVARRCDDCHGSGTREPLADLNLPAHAKAMITTCWQLGGLSELEHLRLRPWAHMLGFRGHFSTKTRRYSTTLGALRDTRRTWRTAKSLAAAGIDPATPVQRLNGTGIDELDEPDGYEDTVIVIGSWCYVGRGHSPGQAVHASTIASDLAEGRRIWRQVRSDEQEAAW